MRNCLRCSDCVASGASRVCWRRRKARSDSAFRGQVATPLNGHQVLYILNLRWHPQAIMLSLATPSICSPTRPQEAVEACHVPVWSCTPTTQHLLILPRAQVHKATPHARLALDGGRVRLLPVNLATTTCRK